MVYMKFEHDNRLVNHIRTCSTNPRDAFNEAQKLKHQCRADWHNVNIEKVWPIDIFMKYTVPLKFYISDGNCPLA